MWALSDRFKEQPPHHVGPYFICSKTCIFSLPFSHFKILRMYLIVDDDIVVIKYMYVQNLVIFVGVLGQLKPLDTISGSHGEGACVCVFHWKEKRCSGLLAAMGGGTFEFYLLLWPWLKTRHAKFSQAKYRSISEKTSKNLLNWITSGFVRVVKADWVE